MTHRDRPSTWRKYTAGMCVGCYSGCCTLPVEVTASDLLRMKLASEDEVAGSLKKLAKRLTAEKRISQFRLRTGLFTLKQAANGDCVYLDKHRRCSIYDSRPDVCRAFPSIGPRPGYCPAQYP